MSSRKLISLCILTAILCSGCQAANSNHSSSVGTSSNLTPTVTISATKAPEVTKSPEAEATPIAEEIRLTEEDALALVQQKINTKKYNISLLSENVTIKAKNYFSFIVTENLTALEPAILVDKYDGKLSCLSSDGKQSEFDTFPTTSIPEKTECNWNGTFVRKDLRGVTTSTIKITQNDSTSFEFQILAENSYGSNRLSGIGHINGKNAKHFTKDEVTLTFNLENNQLTIIDNDYFTKNMNALAGTYFLDKDTETSLTISEEEAIKLIRTLSTIQTGLPAQIEEYLILSDDTSLIIEDRVCYSFGAYAKFNHKNILMTTFYVTVDGNAIYTYNAIENSYELIYGN